MLHQPRGSHTLGQERFQDLFQIIRTRPLNIFRLLAVCNLKSRPHITSIVSDIDLQSLVAIYALAVAEYGVGHLGVEGVEGFGSADGGGDERYLDGIVGARRPWRRMLAVISRLTVFAVFEVK